MSFHLNILVVIADGFDRLQLGYNLKSTLSQGWLPWISQMCLVSLGSSFYTQVLWETWSDSFNWPEWPTKTICPKRTEQAQYHLSGSLSRLIACWDISMFDDKDELAIDRALLTKKTHEIDAQIKRLQAVRDSLNHVANCPEPSHLDCPSFQKMMKSAKHYLWRLTSS